MMKYKYKHADKEWTFNDGTWVWKDGSMTKEIDPGISPITVALPRQPKMEEIAGYGLAPDDQYFNALIPRMPRRLEDLCFDPELTNEQKVERLDNNSEYFAEEIDYIIWYQNAIRKGWWFYNNGKATYLTGDHVFYLTQWFIDGKNPEFRIRDLELFYAIKFLATDDPLCLGLNYPKERQIGATNVVSAVRLVRAITTPYLKTGMQSKDREHAKAIHDYMIHNNWRKLPFYIAPIWDGDVNSTSEIAFYAPKFRGREGYGKKALDSVIHYRDSSEKAYDGMTLDIIHNDEIGKVGSDSSVNVYDRWEKQKYCLKHGDLKHGFALNTSTVDEMENKGGKEFKKLCDESHCSPPIKQSKDYIERQPHKFTASGLYNIFIPSNEGFLMEKKVNGKVVRSIDKFGYANLEWTTKALMEERVQKKNNVEDYLKILRERPLFWDESFLYNVKDCNFNLKILRERLDMLAYMNPKPWRRGNFYRDMETGRVEWTDDPLTGRWFTSKLLSNTESNNVFMKEGKKVPGNVQRFVAGGDPYKYGKKKGSDGGGAIFMKRDYTEDPDDKDITKWTSYNFAATYSYRHREIDRYIDDMILMCEYYGCKMAEETNFSILNMAFTHRGYGEFLHRMYDDRGMLKDEPGQDSQTKQKMEYFRLLDDFIEKHGMRVNHEEILQDCMDLQEDFGKFDRLVACSIALKAAYNESRFVPQKTMTSSHDQALLDFFQEYDSPVEFSNDSIF